MNKSQINAEIWLRVSKIESAVADLQRSRNSQDINSAWEAFLSEFSRWISRMISVGLEISEKKAWAHRLKNYSTGGDEGLYYIRLARNDLEHGLGSGLIANK